MPMKDSHKAESPTITELICINCNNNAEIRVLKVDVPGENPTVISSYECAHCGIRESNVFDPQIAQSSRIGIRIECNFNDKQDLERYVRLMRLTTVVLKKNGNVFEYCTGTTGIFVVESIIRELIDELQNIFGFSLSSEDLARLGGSGMSSISTRSGMSTSSGISSSSVKSVGNKEEAEKQVRNLMEMLRDPKFTMSIEDETGESRVAPRGKRLAECDSGDLKSFDDEQVKHTKYTKKRKHEEMENN